MKQRTNLSLAFADLRKKGYTVKRNFWCCGSCGWAALSEEEAMRAVFYHKQDAADFRRGDDLYLSWSGNGHEIVLTFIKRGLDVIWDETTGKKIIVKQSSII